MGEVGPFLLRQKNVDDDSSIWGFVADWEVDHWLDCVKEVGRQHHYLHVEVRVVDVDLGADVVEVEVFEGEEGHGESFDALRGDKGCCRAGPCCRIGPYPLILIVFLTVGVDSVLLDPEVFIAISWDISLETTKT